MQTIIFDKRVRLPARQTLGAAGYDVFMPCALRLAPGITPKIPLGFGLCKGCIPAGYYIQFKIRSSWVKKHVDIAGGVIDSDYIVPDDWKGLTSIDRCELFVNLKNDSEDFVDIAAGERVFQMLIMPVKTCGEFVEKTGKRPKNERACKTLAKKKICEMAIEDFDDLTDVSDSISDSDDDDVYEDAKFPPPRISGYGSTGKF